MTRRLLPAACFLCLAAGLALVGDQGYQAAKARLAEHLISRAFAAHLRSGQSHPPWPWADTYPIARLEVPRLGVRRTVLAGAGGSSLAFGPGHLDGTAAPNSTGNCCVAGHRDTWFRFLGDLQLGDTVWLETRDARVEYRVTERSVRTMWDTTVLDPRPRAPRLTLVTCWPLDEWRPGPERLVVVALPLGGAGARQRGGTERPVVVRVSDGT